MYTHPFPPRPSPPPFSPHPLLQLRAGKSKPVFNLPIQSAIYKHQIHSPIHVTPLGIPGDEHAFPSHGGPDKALLHYCSKHYDSWREELSESRHLFNGGGFGENLCSEGVDERGVCVGDVVAIGPDVRVQVSEPRAPCFKLNHRFEVRDMAKRTQMSFRTGWYYRVLQTGTITPGVSEIRLLERKHPEWPIARIQYYLYHELDNEEAMQQLVEVEELGEDIKRIFRNRLQKKEVEDQEGRMFGDETLALKIWGEYRIVEKKRETSRVMSFIFEAVEEGMKEVPVEPGSHVRLKLGGKLVRAYSVVDGTSKRFELGVALDSSSRGGSKFLHENTKVGDILSVSRINASFPLAKNADHHIILAGGIGVTAFLTALRYLFVSGQSFEFHLAVDSEVPFQRYLEPLGEKVRIYKKSHGESLDLSSIISRGNCSTHVYCCGPQRLMEGVKKAAKNFGMPNSNVHFETFQVAISGDPFTAELAVSRKIVEVNDNQTLMDALRAVGMEIDSSCEAGNCGTCRVGVCSGRVEHRGTGLMEQEKDFAMLSCVSRGVGHIILEL
ncbi:3-chlorobenzoate-3,4-dioxygenase reductase subunit [Delitschia confertaspora ATCC 74209]|uniref:3-chlorobenzoate-3,4-dioxygenase reductase subunit n=1 Tax=Delitschia confertaspora ATCC 74209 TaxID=1513339 RepID=A0A9P4JR96_9PLEO|nr:3-chlorobenzoate-3,4-dioxygenase reductase subunit [Delitschia confertaspora ATCC 74209]